MTVTTNPSITGVAAPQSAVAITGGTIDGTTIGGTTAGAVTATTLTATGAVSLSPANLSVVVSPTGTGVVTINPATAGTMNNVAIGGSTTAAGSFTALSASGTSTLALTNISNLTSITKSGNSTQILLALRNSDGTASGAGQTRLDFGNDLGTNKATIGLNASTHATKPGWFEILNQANSPLYLGAGGNSTMFIASTGAVSILSTTAPPAGGTASIGLSMSSTANLGIYFGSGVPTLAAAQGSLYLRTDGSTIATRLYINTTGSTVWTNVVTAA